ncbi:helix-turn-helix domain-containing protein [Chryseobacterium sp. YR221]|uniref:helix-turn-helix domain-containing protein n=1 Tax=Chryseobacterium sp. YR221 TaxID=1500293 RepID=UPI0009D8FBA6|nr:helix-turn-helix transcriptional regulator [Chryseobacterium sp. YR221]SMC60987.1 Transcriptional regulator, contains XRE-family HTH domain [Chryseobacterium sp. YR221]
MLTLGTKLTRLRKKKGYSQQEVADLLDISQPAYHKWETDITHPDLENLLKVSKIFDVDLSYLTEEGSNLISNNQFEGSNIVANHQHVINMHSPELIDRVLKNQEQITEILNSQNKLIEALIGKIRE